MAWASETSKPTPSDMPPLTRPHLLILPKQFYYLQTKHPNGEFRGDILIQAITLSKKIKCMKMNTKEHVNL